MSKVTVGVVDVATYAYLGSGQVVGTDLPEPNLNTRSYSSGTANYDRVDRFGRIVTNRWADTTSDVDLYNVALTYDRDSNITSSADAVNPGFDALYGMDNLNRLINADEGTLVTGSISSRTRQELWTLTQTGNWSNHKLDLNGDVAYGGTNELNDTGTFNVVNELTARDKDTNASNDYTLAYDDNGNMTDDGERYTYVYDAFGRLVTVKNRSNSAIIAEYKYNGLNQRIGSHDDTNASGTVDGSDPWYWFVQDSRWRTVATFRASSWGYSGGNDADPKEVTVYHSSGIGGRGGSSYIDGVILSDKDMTNGWGGATDGTREKRFYLLQNWRADVSCVTDQAGVIMEWVKYSAYGVPFRIDPADFDRDGDVDAADYSAFTADYTGMTPTGRVDTNHDGFIDFTDADLYDDNYNAASAGGRNVLSRGGSGSSGIHNRIGYAGYLWDSATSQYHVRNRVFLPNLGRWSRRDPIRYLDGMNLYMYVGLHAIVARDASGLLTYVQCAGTALGDTAECQPRAIKIPPWTADPGGCAATFAADYNRIKKDFEDEVNQIGNEAGLDLTTLVDEFMRQYAIIESTAAQIRDNCVQSCYDIFGGSKQGWPATARAACIGVCYGAYGSAVGIATTAEFLAALALAGIDASYHSGRLIAAAGGFYENMRLATDNYAACRKDNPYMPSPVTPLPTNPTPSSDK